MKVFACSVIILAVIFSCVFRVFGEEPVLRKIPELQEHKILPRNPPRRIPIEFLRRPINTLTPAGSRVKMSLEAIIQYEAYWQVEARNIDFDRIDEFVYGWMNQLGREIDPHLITIVILPWDTRCKDNDTYAPREMRGCLDGLLHDYTVFIHLGDESANKEQALFRIQTNGDGSPFDNEWTRLYPTYPFCGTTLGHELYHMISGVDLNWNFPQNPHGMCN